MTRFVLLSMLLLPLSAAATLRVAQVTPLASIASEPPRDMRKPAPAPLPAPAPTDHYARPSALPPAWKI